MDCAEPEKCFTCFRRTDNFVRITSTSASGENLEEIFAKHFWFTKEQFVQKMVCSSCWERIDDFHRFYCEVEKAYGGPLIEVKVECLDDDEPVRITGMELDQEPLSEVFAEALCKVEHKEVKDGSEDEYKEEDDDDEEEDEDYEEDKEDDDEEFDVSKVEKETESESEKPLAKRRSPRKSYMRKTSKTGKRLKRGRISYMLECKLCGTKSSEVYETFYRLKKHFTEVHKSPAFAVCCKRKFTSREQLGRHFRKYHSTGGNTKAKTTTDNKKYNKRCMECNVYFRNEKGLAKHLFLMHTPDEHKQFKCDLCIKAFADEELLRIHINWHFQVQQKDHYCEPCDRYFVCAYNLKTHKEKHHLEGQEVGPVNATASSSEVASASGAEQAPATDPDNAAADAQPPANDGDEDAPSDSDASDSELMVCRRKWTPEAIAKEEEIIHRVLSLTCAVCDEVLETFQLLKKHGRENHKLKSVKVFCCERSFSRRSRLYEHCLSVHVQPDAFECEHCGRRFTESSGLRHHKWWMHTPASERPFKCDICGNTFMKEYLLKQHINRHLEQERKSFKCQECDRTLSTAFQLRAHMQSLHGEPSTWVCDVCAKGFTHRSLLEQHRMAHTPEGLAKISEQCKKCNKWYNSRKSYVKHRRRCGVHEPVKCEVCEHVAVNDLSLKSHMKLRHTNRPKYPCTYCGKEFSRELRLKEHEANHAGIVLYKCEYCPRMCNSSSNMYTHKKVAHPEQWAQKMAARYAPPVGAATPQ
ncbi:transcription factor grauzone-like [Armigeres subalbatus]|uniref:transcription factor grauzone-like n=1 Tax=Armigeres subalbatus TaxID=124917 RepID=UPI002ED25CEB